MLLELGDTNSKPYLFAFHHEVFDIINTKLSSDRLVGKSSFVLSLKFILKNFVLSLIFFDCSLSSFLLLGMQVLPNMACVPDIEATSYDICGIVRSISSGQKVKVICYKLFYQAALQMKINFTFVMP